MRVRPARSTGRVEIKAAKVTAVEAPCTRRVTSRGWRQSSDALRSCKYTPPASESFAHRQGHPAGCGNASYQPCHVALISSPNSRHTTIILPVPLGTCPTLAPHTPFSQCADKTFVQATTDVRTVVRYTVEVARACKGRTELVRLVVASTLNLLARLIGSSTTPLTRALYRQADSGRKYRPIGSPIHRMDVYL